MDSRHDQRTEDAPPALSDAEIADMLAEADVEIADTSPLADVLAELRASVEAVRRRSDVDERERDRSA